MQICKVTKELPARCFEFVSRSIVYSGDNHMYRKKYLASELFSHPVSYQRSSFDLVLFTWTLIKAAKASLACIP